MICPNCREDNSPGFRFCGMCGTPLELKRATPAPALDPLSAFAPNSAPSSTSRVPTAAPVPTPVPISRKQSAPAARQSVGVESSTRSADKPLSTSRPANRDVPPISGPSMLGLDQVTPTPARPSSFDFDQHDESQSDADRHNASAASHHQPSMDALRERAFSGLDSFYEPEEPKTGGRRILLLVILLAALGGAGWYIYTNYIGEDRKPQTTASSTTDSGDRTTKPDSGATTDTPRQTASTPPPASASQSTPPPASSTVPEGPSENATPIPDAAANPPAEGSAKPAPVTKAPASPAETAPASRPASRHAALAGAVRTPKAAAVEEGDKGDADFRKGEAYLYGRGAPENCNEAVKNLKAASAKSNAKARSAFGTMYATGHCVPRDLPTSYTWFALALRADPSNQILEKDLTAIWNEMTPPERQLATRMKQ